MALNDWKCGNCKDRACSKNFSIENSLVKAKGLDRQGGSVGWPEEGAGRHGALLRLCRAQKAVGRFCAVPYSWCRNRGISAMRDYIVTQLKIILGRSKRFHVVAFSEKLYTMLLCSLWNSEVCSVILCLTAERQPSKLSMLLDSRTSILTRSLRYLF